MSKARKKEKIEYGDFQTPPALARRVCVLLAEQGIAPAALVEPTCGLGSFLFAGLDRFHTIRRSFAADINAEYVAQTASLLRQRPDADKVSLTRADFFAADWPAILRGLPEPFLVLGNPPWVTNARLGTLASANLPQKSNFQKHNGLDALTGKSNFDISESMLIRLFELLDGRSAALAMLCKSSTARKVVTYAWKNGIALERTAIYGIDADLHFDAAVDAVLLVAVFQLGSRELRAKTYASLQSTEAPHWIGYTDGTLVADMDAYAEWKHLCGESPLKWRSGIKHDCAQVMELRPEGGMYRNGLGELVELEGTFLYPMLKSSDVANRRSGQIRRVVLVTQSKVGGDTRCIEAKAPQTWAYLQLHRDRLDSRASSIYRNRPEFSIFGVGDYSFAAWKVAISGFYKTLRFFAIGPLDGKPVMLDDTSYFLACESEEQAEFLAAMLNSREAQAFFGAFVFWDNKRPITVDLLGRLDLRKLARELGMEATFAHCFGSEQSARRPARSGSQRETSQLQLWSK